MARTLKNETAPVKLTGKARLKRLAKRVLRTLVLTYLVACVVMYLFQEKLIFPGAPGRGLPTCRSTPGLTKPW